MVILDLYRRGDRLRLEVLRQEVDGVQEDPLAEHRAGQPILQLLIALTGEYRYEVHEFWMKVVDCLLLAGLLGQQHAAAAQEYLPVRPVRPDLPDDRLDHLCVAPDPRGNRCHVHFRHGSVFLWR